MQRPVRSFKSFIRAIPPRTSPNKPLPPLPVKSEETRSPSLSSILTIQTRSTRLSLWEAPPSWDNDDNCQEQSTPPFALREYSPLIPEPPEDIAAMQADPILWQQGHGPFQQTLLDPIRERTAVTPEVPPRNPSRPALSASYPASTIRVSRDTLPSVYSRHSTSTHGDGLLGESLENDSVGSPTELPSPLDLVSALKDMSMTERAISSLGPGSRRDRGIMWDNQHQRSDSAQLEGEPSMILQDNKLKTFRKGSAIPEDISDRSDDLELSDKMQAMIFAQDYHNVLARQSLDDNDQYRHNDQARTLHQNPEYTPRPLMWKKDSGCPPPSTMPERPQLPATSSSGRYRNLRMMSSWVNHRTRKDPRTGLNQRSISDPAGISHAKLPESDVDRQIKNEARLANFVQQGRDLISRKILRRQSEPPTPLLISLPIPQQSCQTSTNPPAFVAPFELAKPVFRLPGGLTVVRQTSSSMLRPQTADGSPTLPSGDLPWLNSPVQEQVQYDLSRSGSTQCIDSQSQAARPSAHERNMSSPLALPRAPGFFSHSTISLPTLVPHEDPSLSPSTYKPPQSRRRSHNIGSPLTTSPASHSAEYLVPESLESVINKLNVFEKARHAHDAWKKHQKTLKSEKLKQSIRLVGPAPDSKNIAGYIESAVHGRESGDSGIGVGQLPGHALKGTC